MSAISFFSPFSSESSLDLYLKENSDLTVPSLSGSCNVSELCRTFSGVLTYAFLDSEIKFSSFSINSNYLCAKLNLLRDSVWSILSGGLSMETKFFLLSSAILFRLTIWTVKQSP